MKTRRPLVIGLWFFLTTSAPGASLGATYYVATTGTDSAPCTQASPCQTIARAYNSFAAPGDTISVAPGVYAEYKPEYGIHLNKNGTAAAPITLKSSAKWGAVLDGGATAPQRTPYYRKAIVYVSASYNTVDGFELRNSPMVGVDVWGSNTTIRNNNIHHNGTNGDPAYSYGHDGIYTSQYARGTVMANNWVHHNGRPQCAGEQHCNLDHGLYLTGDDEQVLNNLITYNEAYGIHLRGEDSIVNLKVLNNVLAWNNKKTFQGGLAFWKNFDGVQIKNNIFYKNAGWGITSYKAHGSGIVIDKNVYFGNPSGVFNPTGEGSDYTYTHTNAMSVNPLFVNETSDFHLQANSPALNVGVTLAEVATDYEGTARPQEALYEIGAYEQKKPDGACPECPTCEVCPPPPVELPLCEQITVCVSGPGAACACPSGSGEPTRQESAPVDPLRAALERLAHQLGTLATELQEVLRQRPQ